jgi:CBS domain-containing protein
MKTIIIKNLMVPIHEYATVSQDATLQEAVLALGKAQQTVDPLKFKHRAILVFDKSGNIVGKLTMLDILTALEPKYGQMEAIGTLSRSGHSPDFIKSMLKDKVFWDEPLEFICGRANMLRVSDFMVAPADGAYIDENATLSEAMHQLVVDRYQSLLVTADTKVVGVLRLSDVFTQVCDKIKTSEI